MLKFLKSHLKSLGFSIMYLCHSPIFLQGDRRFLLMTLTHYHRHYREMLHMLCDLQ